LSTVKLLTDGVVPTNVDEIKRELNWCIYYKLGNETYINPKYNLWIQIQIRIYSKNNLKDDKKYVNNKRLSEETSYKVEEVARPEKSRSYHKT